MHQEELKFEIKFEILVAGRGDTYTQRNWTLQENMTFYLIQKNGESDDHSTREKKRFPALDQLISFLFLLWVHLAQSHNSWKEISDQSI